MVLEVDVCFRLSRKSISHREVSSLSAETPPQLLHESLFVHELHRRANNKRSERKKKTPRTCNGVKHLPHSIQSSEDRDIITPAPAGHGPNTAIRTASPK